MKLSSSEFLSLFLVFSPDCAAPASSLCVSMPHLVDPAAAHPSARCSTALSLGVVRIAAEQPPVDSYVVESGRGFLPRSSSPFCRAPLFLPAVKASCGWSPVLPAVINTLVRSLHRLVLGDLGLFGNVRG